MTRRQPRRALLTATLGYFAAMASCIMLLACSLGHADDRSRLHSFTRSFASTNLQDMVLSSAEFDRPVRIEHALERPYDAYAEWNRWCEGPATSCQTDADCRPDRTGRRQRCYLPYWAKTKDAKVCAIPRLRRSERKEMQENVQRIVVAISGRRGNPEALGAWIGLIGMRETTMRPWKQHRMSGDVKLAQTTWAKRYQELAPVNPYYQDSDRFQGWGLLGQQWTFALAWDRAAPPEILCRPAVAIETYLHCARRTHLKQTSMGITPTWETLHASCSGGKVRPQGPSEDFRKRARRAGLDPEQPVPVEWLGVSPGKTPLERNLTLRLIEAAVAHVQNHQRS